jgi:hypothetical protein
MAKRPIGDRCRIEGDFTGRRYSVARRFLSADVCRLFSRYILLKHELGRMEKPDPRIPTAPRMYGDILSETLLLEKQEIIEAVVKTPLWPSYSYVRLHPHGASMSSHQDRPPSEIGVSINMNADRPWPLWFRVGNEDVPVELDIGDAVIYCGRELPHWRETYEGNQQLQCMLFYVRQNGDCAEYRYDRRERIGAPSVPPVLLQAEVSGQNGPGE